MNADRVAVVTGAGGAIGAATVRALATDGFALVMHDVGRTATLDALTEEFGSRAKEVICDLSDPLATDGLWDVAIGWRGKVDVLVNNAGIYEQAAIDAEFPTWLASWHRTLSVNLVAVAALCRRAVVDFARQDGGIIVNLASRAAFRGEDPDYWHYAASKAGVVAITRTIARQYGRQGVTAFAVAPGFVNTSFNRDLIARYGLEFFAADTGLGEVAQPEDIAHIIRFLASGAARHATGTTIDVNGASYVR